MFVKNPSKKNHKFTLSKYRILLYEKNDLGTLLKCSESVSVPVYSEFDLKNKKVLLAVSLPDENKLYSSPRKLKKNKFDHVMALAENYVPQCDQWFYTRIKDSHTVYEEPNADTSVSEFSSDE